MQVKSCFWAIARNAGLGETLQYPHVVQHTVAMPPVQQGASAFLIRQALGHKSFDSTLAWVNRPMRTPRLRWLSVQPSRIVVSPNERAARINLTEPWSTFNRCSFSRHCIPYLPTPNIFALADRRDRSFHSCLLPLLVPSMARF